MRYEIRDITPPVSVKAAMDRQAEAVRRKQATISDSEGHRQAEINVAEGMRQAAILQAQGEASALLEKAKASAAAVDAIALSVSNQGGKQAVSFRIAEQYVENFGKLAKKSTTMILPAKHKRP